MDSLAVTSIVLTVLLVLATALLAVHTWRRTKREPRRLSNAAWIVGTLLVGGAALLMLGDATLVIITLLVMVSAPFLVLGLVIFLLVNGIVMFRREGNSLGNRLSLLAGIALAMAVVLALGLMVVDPGWAPLSMWLVLAGGWVAVVFFTYLAYSLVYQRLAARVKPDFLMVLGSGIKGDRVTPLLASRIDRALELYVRERRAGRHPLLVMSGGKGHDEQISEAEAMARYASEQGIVPPEDLLLEDRSATTEQNLRFTHELVRADPRLGPDARGLAVTSSYHAMRAASLAQKVGAPVQVTGAKTAGYFWPSAVLREFVAVVRGSLVPHAVAFALFTLPLPALLLASVLAA